MGMNQSGSQHRCNIWSAQYAAADGAADVIASSIWWETFNALLLFIGLLLKVFFVFHQHRVSVVKDINVYLL